jgi:SWI/SNF-related matrix-associated actin-dependent regulator of chromatin subfamily A-like protein 1
VSIELIQPYPYQLTGAAWLATKTQAMLLDVPGLGKSCQAIRGVDLLGIQNILVIAPASTRVNWGREWMRFSPIDRKVQVCMPTDLPNTSGVVIVSYDSAVKHRDRLRAAEFELLILDEAHFCKEKRALRTRAIYGTGKHSPGIASTCKRVWRLTGTPLPNSAANELWTHLRSAGLADEDYWTFTYRYCEGYDAPHGFQFTKNKNVQELQNRIAPFILRRTREEVLPDLPEIVYSTHVVERSKACLDAVAITSMNADDQRLRVVLEAAGDDKEKQLHILESMSASMQSLRRHILSAKLPAMAQVLIEDFEEHGIEKMVVFGIHRQGIEWMAEKLAAYKPAVLYGGTQAGKRQDVIDQFQNDRSCGAFLANIDSGGTGVDGLQRVCSNVSFMEKAWTPSSNLQAVLRLLRIGQSNKVAVRSFVLDKSTDEYVDSVLVRKMKELAKIF